jgi:polysaccharide pyruvyl transferase WcaK-like protein
LVSKYTNKKVFMGFDTAILLEDFILVRNKVTNEAIKNIGFSFKPCFSSNLKNDYLTEAITKEISKILDNIGKINIWFLAFNTSSKEDESDLILMKKIMQKLPAKTQKHLRMITYRGDINNFLLQLSRLDAVICCKYHSIIFSYLLKKPMLVIAYHPKDVALVADIGLPENPLFLEDILNGKVYEALLVLLNNPRRYEPSLPLYEAKRRALNGILGCMQKCLNR